MPVDFNLLTVGNEYDRPDLVRLWGYKGIQALARGVVTPAGMNAIILFITENQQPSLPQYDNRFDGELLWMDGELGHRSDQRLAGSDGRDDVHLFYREKDHSPFTYRGTISLIDAFITGGDRPSRFVFTSKPQLITEAENVLAENQSVGAADHEPGEEGRKKTRLHIIYERSRKNREKALEIHGRACKACDFNFDRVYGADLADSYIEIHHLKSITEINGQSVDPATELAPLCSNCHRMAHRRQGTIIPIDELRRRVLRYRSIDEH